MRQRSRTVTSQRFLTNFLRLNGQVASFFLVQPIIIKFNMIVQRLFPIEHLSTRMVGNYVGDCAIRPYFRALSVPVLIRTNRCFRREVLRHLLHLQRITSGARANSVRPLYGLLMGNRLYDPIAAPTLLSRVCVYFFRFRVCGQKCPRGHYVFPTEGDGGSDACLGEVCDFPEGDLWSFASGTVKCAGEGTSSQYLSL